MAAAQPTLPYHTQEHNPWPQSPAEPSNSAPIAHRCTTAAQDITPTMTAQSQGEDCDEGALGAEGGESAPSHQSSSPEQ